MISPIRWVRKRWYVFLTLFVVFGAMYAGWRIKVTRGYKIAAGTYLTTAGQTYLVIEQKPFGKLSVGRV